MTQTETNSTNLVSRALIAIALVSLTSGLIAWGMGYGNAAQWIWAFGTAPVAIGLLVSMVEDFLAGRVGVDAVAFVSMTAALILGENLAGIVVAIMYAGGAVLEDFAIERAQSDLKSLVDRAPRVAHRSSNSTVEEIPIEDVCVNDQLMVRAGEVVPVDGILLDENAVLDESALTGEPLPVNRTKGETIRSGSVNTGAAFAFRATATAGESTYAGIVRMVTAAQAAKAPFIRLADQFAIFLLPITLAVAGVAWLYSGDPVRGLAVLVAATPCPLIIAAPVAFIAGVSQAARKGILIKGGGPLEALARTHTVMFDKTGTLTVGGARLIAVEAAPGQNADEILRLAASLEQASQHILAEAITEAARHKGLALQIPERIDEAAGSGLSGIVGGRRVLAGSYQFVCGSRKAEGWAQRVLRRASWRSALSVFVSVDGQAIGALLLADELRRETPRAVQLLRDHGVKRVVMVTGDRADAADIIGSALDLEAVLADREPADKVQAVATEQRLRPTLMVGDGINDAPALAAADVGIAMGVRGASASSEAADVVVMVDRIDRVADAVGIARYARGIALQSIVVGLSLSGIAMGFAAVGLLSPVAGALAQEAIDVAVILNALRANFGPWKPGQKAMPAASAIELRQEHKELEGWLDRLREISDGLDDAERAGAVSLISEANQIITERVLAHERNDEARVYPKLGRFLSDGHGLGAMSRAHREIQHLGRMLDRLAAGLTPEDADRYLVRDAQRVIESLEALVRVHNAQEEDIFEHAVRG